MINSATKNRAYGSLAKYADEKLRNTEKNVMEREIVKKYKKMIQVIKSLSE